MSLLNSTASGGVPQLNKKQVMSLLNSTASSGLQYNGKPCTTINNTENVIPAKAGIQSSFRIKTHRKRFVEKIRLCHCEKRNDKSTSYKEGLSHYP